MPGPVNDVAKLIMDLMSRGRAGGMPMNASPELVQYLAHAQGGTTPPQYQMNPPADVLQGPGSGAAAIRDPDFEEYLNPNYKPPGPEEAASISRFRDELTGRNRGMNDGDGPDNELNPVDLLEDSPRLPNQTFRQESYGDFQGEPLFIWAKNKKGKMIKIDGPFENDIIAARELRGLRQAGLDVEVEIRPDWPVNPT